MRTEEYFRSLSDECETLKNRVRYLINDAHWPTDGEWKESVLRSMIRRSAPQSITVGRGFVVNHERCSNQIDVLLYDNTLPILYKDGDLVFVTPSSCRAIIEVKTRVSAQQFQAASEKLAEDAEFIRSAAIGYPLFVGIFAYELKGGGGRRLLESLQTIASGNENRVVDHASLGASKFIKYWSSSPSGNLGRYSTWHLYNLERMAPGYFIHNLLANVCRDPMARREDAWFPQESKEVHLEETEGFISDAQPGSQQDATR